MKKSELLKILAKYDDDQEILVEAIDAGFDDPVLVWSNRYFAKARFFLTAPIWVYKLYPYRSYMDFRFALRHQQINGSVSDAVGCRKTIGVY